MCGISGIITYQPQIKASLDTIRSFSSFNRYRGPDEYGEKLAYAGNLHVQLAHHRLSILDLKPTGSQPLANDDGTVILVYNGEVFNFLELKSKLLQENITFKGTGDTEVILKAYEHWGIEKTLSQLEGMFVLCIADLSTKRIYIARDSFGKKPLYYLKQNGLFSFSSDIRSFKKLGVTLSVNTEALGYYFGELSTPEQQSIFNEVNKVMPGSCITLEESGEHTINFFRKLSFNTRKTHPDENVEDHIEHLLTSAIKSRLVADVQVVSFLSGGIDSGLISAIAAQNYSQKISTYTVGYQNYQFDEIPFARLVAEKYNTDHHEIILNPTNTEIIDQLIEEFGEPFADSSMIPSYYVCSALSSRAKVALSGDGGDELFLGYPTYVQAARMQNIFNNSDKFSWPLKLMADLTSHPKLNYYSGIVHNDLRTISGALHRSMGFSQREIQQLFQKNDDRIINAVDNEFLRVLQQGAEEYNSMFSAIWYGTFKTRLLNDYLVKVDRSSMFASVEVRSPFLDDKLQEYVCSLPHKVLMSKEQGKFLLKKIAQKYLPPETLNKPKTGFEIPVGEWFRTSWKNRFIETVLDKPQTHVDLNYAFIEKIFDEHLRGKNHDHKIWSLYVFHYWIHTFYAE